MDPRKKGGHAVCLGVAAAGPGIPRLYAVDPVQDRQQAVGGTVGLERMGVFFCFTIAETLSRRKSNSDFFRLFSKKCDRAWIASARVIHFKKEFAEKRGEISCKIRTFVVE
ncbi:MAG: hypothetical protein IIZ00_03410 [Oscillospiraceae bacterium]|nr:hypothetical protein [Oscillospiraceae bacterium]